MGTSRATSATTMPGTAYAAAWATRATSPAPSTSTAVRPIWTSARRPIALANPNQQYVCFFPVGGYEGLDLTGTDGEFQVEWFNPVTGVSVAGEPLPAKSDSPHAVFQRAALRAPFDGPAVLLLFKERIDLPRKHKIYVSGT